LTKESEVSRLVDLEMRRQTAIVVAIVAASVTPTTRAFGTYCNQPAAPSPSSIQKRCVHLAGVGASSTSVHMAPGGWGIGPSKEIQDEEFANRGNTRGYDKYELQNQGQFMRRVREERSGLKKKKANELLEIAKMAGIMDKKKLEERGDRLDKFETEDMSDDEDLDVRVF